MSFKEFNQATDVSTQLAIVNEIIPISGTAISGNLQVQHFINIVSGSSVSGGFWQTVWDGSPSSVSSSALVDFTFGFSSASYEFTASNTFEVSQKTRVYNEMSALLNGNKNTLFSFNNTNYNDLFFIIFKRRIFKDEIQKATMNITLQMSGGVNDTLVLTDNGAASTFTVGAAGDQASLFSGTTAVGAVYYDAGVVVFHTGVFMPVGALTGNIYWSGSSNNLLQQISITGSIDNLVDGFRNRINQIQFNNQTNLHNTIYFARALNNEFNYSSNPTFIDSAGRIIPTSGSANQTRTYICSVGLYDINNNLMAVAKASTPIKKSPDNEVIFRVKLSY